MLPVSIKELVQKERDIATSTRQLGIRYLLSPEENYWDDSESYVGPRKPAFSSRFGYAIPTAKTFWDGLRREASTMTQNYLSVVWNALAQSECRLSNRNWRTGQFATRISSRVGEKSLLAPMAKLRWPASPMHVINFFWSRNILERP